MRTRRDLLRALASSYAVAGLAKTTVVGTAVVVEQIFDSWCTNRSDSALAHALAGLTLNQQLNPHLLTYFRNFGIGPQSLDVLTQLQRRAVNLPLPPDPILSIQPLPTEMMKNDLLSRGTDFAKAYAQRLPNFICDQVTRRFSNYSEVSRQFSANLHHRDNLKWQLRFVDGTEEGNVLNVWQKKGGKTPLKSGQSLSRGEFGGDLGTIFTENRAHTTFAFHHWQHWGGKQTAVFTYAKPKAGTSYSVAALTQRSSRSEPELTSARSSMTGFVYLNAETAEITRFTIEAGDLPLSFPIQQSRTIVNYGPISLGGTTWTLPVSAIVFMAANFQATQPPQLTENHISFQNYRKFNAESELMVTDSKITFRSPKKSSDK